MADIKAWTNVRISFQADAISAMYVCRQQPIHWREKPCYEPSGRVTEQPAAESVYNQGLQAEMCPYQPQVVAPLQCLVSAMVAECISANILKQLGAPDGSNIFRRIQIGLHAQWRVVKVPQYQAGRIPLHDDAGRNVLAQRCPR